MLLVTAENFEQEVKNCTIPVVCDFWATWCPPCRILKPIIQTLSDEANDQYKVVMVDADQSLDLCSEYKIASLPTVIIFKNGVESQRFVGVQSKEKFLQAIQG
jgi:thioredoxin 1